MRGRDLAIRKACPPHRWALQGEAGEPDRGTCMHAIRVCADCKLKEHAVIAADVLESTPKSLWHHADAGWTKV